MNTANLGNFSRNWIQLFKKKNGDKKGKSSQERVLFYKDGMYYTTLKGWWEWSSRKGKNDEADKRWDNAVAEHARE